MGKLAAFAALFLALAQEKKAESDLKYEKEAGVSCMKPPKNDEWEFKERGWFSNSKIYVGHKVDELMVEIYFQSGASTGLQTVTFDPKKIIEDEWTKLSSNADNKEAVKKEVRQTKIAGNNATYLHATFKRAERPLEIREYAFVARENQSLYLVLIWGEEGMYKKHQKFADYIVSTIKTWKLPK